MKKFVVLLIIGIAAAGVYTQLQAPNESALEAYLRYQSTVLAGRTFEEDAAFYTAGRQAEIQARIDSVEDAEGMKDAYLNMTQTQAACSDLTLAEETQNGDVTRLVFDVTDTCGSYNGAEVQEIIELVEENGRWKISLNETSISN